MPTKVQTLSVICTPGQLGTKAYCRALVVLISPDGQFGTGGSITLTSLNTNGQGPMAVVEGFWKQRAIVATFPTNSPGDGNDGEVFKVTVTPTGGSAIEASPVEIFGLDGEGGYPPTM